MTKFVSRRGVLGVALEASRGTAVSPTYWMPWAKLSFADKIASAAEEQGMGNIADQDSFYVTMQMGEGELDAQIYDSGLGYILSSLLGAVPVTSGAGPYTHTFTLSQSNQAKTLSLYWKDPNTSYMFPMAVVESLKMSVAPNGLVEYTVHFKSKKARDWSSENQDFTSTGNKFLHQHASIKLASNIAGLSGATAPSLKSLEMTINRSVMFDEVIGTSEPEDILSQPIGIEGSFGLNYEDTTYHDYMMNNTYRAMQVQFLRSTSSSLTIQMPRVSFMEWEQDRTLNEISKQKVNFKANYDAANALDIISSCVLVNGKTSY